MKPKTPAGTDQDPEEADSALHAHRVDIASTKVNSFPKYILCWPNSPCHSRKLQIRDQRTVTVMPLEPSLALQQPSSMAYGHVMFESTIHVNTPNSLSFIRSP